MGIQHLAHSLVVNAAQCTEAGVKAINDDCVGIREPEGSLLTTKGVALCIADGVSAAEAGKEASEACVQGFLSDYYSTPDSWSVTTSAQKVISALNRWLYGQGQHFFDASKGFVTTLSVLILKSKRAYLFHVGDSRIYLYRDGDFEQLTHDHTSHVDGKKAFLSRAMGINLNLDIDYKNLELFENDVLILTTDGVHEFVSDREMRDIAAQNSGNPSELCKQLIAAAKNNNSNDNLSCQAVCVDQLGAPSADDVYQTLTSLPFPPDLEVGCVLDGFEVLDVIHASTRSSLYKVRDRESGEILAMKTPSVNFDDDLAYIERFSMEEWVGSRIDTPFVVKVVAPQRERTCLYYLTEFIEGGTLAQWNQSDIRHNIQQIIGLIEKVSKGLQALHRKETLHQDLKPDNIVINHQGNPIIIDFGSVAVAGISEINAGFERDVILGTADYSAPEYILGGKHTKRSDLFSLAVITYEALTGKLPYGENFANCKSLADFSRLNYKPSYIANPLVPVWIDAALERALHINPEARYKHLSEFIHDLNFPNPAFLDKRSIPFMEKNPLLFWKITAGVLALTQLATLFALGLFGN